MDSDCSPSRETFSPVSDDTLSGAAIVPISDFTPYYAYIPEPYLTYLRSYAIGMTPIEDYVAYVTQESKYVNSQWRTTTVYNIAIGDLSYDGANFSGDVEIHKIYASPQYFGQFAKVTDNSFVLTPAEALVYTSVGSDYPDIASQSIYSKYVFYLLIFIVFITLLRRLFHG